MWKFIIRTVVKDLKMPSVGMTDQLFKAAGQGKGHDNRGTEWPDVRGPTNQSWSFRPATVVSNSYGAAMQSSDDCDNDP